MADFSKFFHKLMILEGGYSNNSVDRGGATNWGISLNTWIDRGYDKNGDGKINAEDVKLVTQEDAMKIAKQFYWDKILGDRINSQSVAEFIADWCYNSGTFTVIKKTQRLMGLEADGVFGNVTLKNVNISDAKTLFGRLKASREAWVRAIVENNPKQIVFLKGWMSRINSFQFES